VPESDVANLEASPTAVGPKSLEAGLLDGIGDAVIATDPDGRVILNRAAQELYGWRPEEVLGRNILDVTPTANRRRPRPRSSAAFATARVGAARFPSAARTDIGSPPT
jgi:PAS domain-containing protein